MRRELAAGGRLCLLNGGLVLRVTAVSVGGQGWVLVFSTWKGVLELVRCVWLGKEGAQSR